MIVKFGIIMERKTTTKKANFLKRKHGYIIRSLSDKTYKDTDVTFFK